MFTSRVCSAILPFAVDWSLEGLPLAELLLLLLFSLLVDSGVDSLFGLRNFSMRRFIRAIKNDQFTFLEGREDDVCVYVCGVKRRKN